MVRPLPEAHVVVFRSYGEGHYGGEYYDTLTLENVTPKRYWRTR